MVKKLTKVVVKGVEVEVPVEIIEQPSGTEPKCTVLHMRDGKVINEITPYSDAGIIGKVLYHLGLKNYTITE